MRIKVKYSLSFIEQVSSVKYFIDTSILIKYKYVLNQNSQNNIIECCIIEILSLLHFFYNITDACALGLSTVIILLW